MKSNTTPAAERPAILAPEMYRTDRLEDESWRADPRTRKPPKYCSIDRVVSRRCCGWMFRPTRAAVIEAMRGREKNDPDKLACAAVVVLESEAADLERMLSEGLFSAADAAWWLQPGRMLDRKRGKVLEKWLKPERRLKN